MSQNFLRETQPVYELGAGTIILNIPNYPGANNNQFRVVPFPYVIYRGKVLRADDEGTRARLLSSKHLETGLSFGFNFPIKSEQNSSRQGMPDLDALVSLGPRVLYRIVSAPSQHRLNLSVATKAVFSSNFKSRFRSEGLSIEPSLNYWYQFPQWGTTLFSRLGFEFGSVKLNRFFYEVQSQYTTATRASYGANAGLIESSLSLGFGHSFYRNKLFLFSALSWRNLQWAKNRESPLVESRDNMGIILGLVWTFFESKETVRRKARY